MCAHRKADYSHTIFIKCRLVFGTRCEVVHSFLDIVLDRAAVWREFGHLGHSLEGLLHSRARGRRARLHEPVPGRANLPEVKPLGYLGDSQSAVDVLFVGQQDEGPPAQLLAPQRVLQLPVRLVQTLPVRAVHHEHDGRHVVVEALPVLPHLPLAADVPDGQGDVLPVLFGVQHLHVEADGGRGGDEGVVLQLVEEGGLPRVVQAQEQDLGLWLFGAPLSHGDASTETVSRSQFHSVSLCNNMYLPPSNGWAIRSTPAVKVCATVGSPFFPFFLGPLHYTWQGDELWIWNLISLFVFFPNH